MSYIAYRCNKKNMTRVGTILRRWDSRDTFREHASIPTALRNHYYSAKDVPETSAALCLSASQQRVRIAGTFFIRRDCHIQQMHRATQ